MMWRVHPDHGENAEIGKAKTSDHSRQTRVWRGPSPNNHLMSALQPADCGLEPPIIQSPKSSKKGTLTDQRA
jgi:hypothetical protein